MKKEPVRGVAAGRWRCVPSGSGVPHRCTAARIRQQRGRPRGVAAASVVFGRACDPHQRIANKQIPGSRHLPGRSIQTIVEGAIDALLKRARRIRGGAAPASKPQRQRRLRLPSPRIKHNSAVNVGGAPHEVALFERRRGRKREQSARAATRAAAMRSDFRADWRENGLAALKLSEDQSRSGGSHGTRRTWWAPVASRP